MTTRVSTKERRIRKEIERSWNPEHLTNAYLYPLPVMFIDFAPHTEECCFLVSFYREKFTCIVTLQFKDKCYPFKAPEVIINGMFDYKRLLAFSAEWNDKFGIEKCLCCSSILCRWGPSYNMTNILKEVYENLSYKLRISETLMCRSLIRQKFGHYIPIEEFL